MKKNIIVFVIIAAVLLGLYFFTDTFKLSAKTGNLDVLPEETTDNSLIAPCPEDYPDNQLWWTPVYNCSDMGDMLEMKAFYEIEGYTTYGPNESPTGYKCKYYLWVCRRAN